jgi:hypothetical protein
VALVVKYADNICKGFGHSISLVFCNSLSSVVFEDIAVNEAFMLGSFMVLASSAAYASITAGQLPAVTPRPAAVTRSGPASTVDGTAVVAPATSAGGSNSGGVASISTASIGANVGGGVVSFRGTEEGGAPSSTASSGHTYVVVSHTPAAVAEATDPVALAGTGNSGVDVERGLVSATTVPSTAAELETTTAGGQQKHSAKRGWLSGFGFSRGDSSRVRES